MAQEPNGVIYYKLRSPYDGDTTKNCGLLGSEVDSNFFFLRGNDIKTAYTEDDEDKKYLVLERLNGEKIKADITGAEGEWQFKVEDGYVYVKTPDGEEIPFGDEYAGGNPVKFLVEGDSIRVVTDDSINGDGTYDNPLGLDMTYYTGTYAPADFFADLSCRDADINDVKEGVGYGHAIITRENVSRFGALYTFGQAKAIDNELSRQGGGWRVPTKDDWGKLLNWAEYDDEHRNHITDECKNLGCVAGARLKTTTLWAGKINDDDFGFSIFPVGGCFEDANTARPETEYDYWGLYEVTNFWTSTEKNGEVYTRKFSYGHDDVYQGTTNKAARLSIRLVRDIDGDFDLSDYAVILGNHVPVIVTTDGKQQWTAINISLTNYEGYKPSEVTVPAEWGDIETEIPARQYYELVVDGEDEPVYEYVPVEEYEIPSYAEPVEVDEKPEHPDSGSDQFIFVTYFVHLDMTSDPKLFYNVWDGKRWHKKMMKEGESVVILNEDVETPCSSMPYVTEANRGHEWRVILRNSGETAYDDLCDVHEAIDGEIERIKEELNVLSATVIDFIDETHNNFESAFTAIDETMDEMHSGFTSAFTAIDETRDEMHSGFTSAFTAIDETRDEMHSGFTSAFTAIDALSAATINLSAVTKEFSAATHNSFVSAFTRINEVQDEINSVEEGAGLDENGHYIAPLSGITKDATSLADAIIAIDSALCEDEYVVSQALNDLNTRVEKLSGDTESLFQITDNIQTEVNTIEEAVGLEEDGSHKQSTGRYTSDASTIEGEILALDEQLGTVSDRRIEAEDASVVVVTDNEGLTTIKVNIDPEDKHLKLDGERLIFDGDFGELF